MKEYTLEEIMDAFEECAKQRQDLEQENKHLNLQLDQALKDYDEELTKRYKAIEYIKEHNVLAVNKEYLPSGIERCCSAELLEILGDDIDE